MGCAVSKLRTYCRDWYALGPVSDELRNSNEDCVKQQGSFKGDKNSIHPINLDTLHIVGISERWKPCYSHWLVRIMKEKGGWCVLKDILHVLPFVPTEHEYILVKFETWNGDKYKVPYCLKYDEDPFPYDPGYCFNRAMQDIEQVILFDRPDPNLDIVETDMTVIMRDFGWQDLKPAFTYHRPYAWRWLLRNTTDKAAILALRKRNYVASLKLATGEVTPFVKVA